jgi:ribonuclease R
MPRRPVPGLPSRQQILDFISESPTPAGKRELSRAFGLHGQEKIALKALLKDMADEGLIDSAPGRAFHKMGGVPKVTVLRIVEVGDDGQPIATPENWQGEGVPPKLRVIEGRKRSALGIGDRILARTEEAGRGLIAHPMKKLARGTELMLGVLHREGDALWLKPVDKRERRDMRVSDAGDADVGDLVLAEKAGRPPRITAKVVERLGDPFAPRSFSLVAIHKFDLPHVFSDDMLEEAARVAKQPLGEISPPFVSSEVETRPSTSLGTNGKREDLRHLPIVAIDPADARDHDDAVWAEPDDDPENKGGFKAIVAIADVSFYVRTDNAIDREARRRGNSVYFPDRVVPMLPEILSADICSLKENEDRAALVCHLTISAAGKLTAFHFTRAVVRIAANIAYEDAQALIDGRLAYPGFRRGTLENLWACWAALSKARDARKPLDLDLPERRVMLDEKGRITSVAPRERLDAHRLIEDYMIAANVAAAKALEAKKAPVMYRVHEPPGREKLVALKDYLATFGIDLALGQVIRPETFNRVIERIEDEHVRPEIMQAILRSQTQAYYAPRNQGHFGLALGSYAHFTSPIRRYSDLLVHRSLVDAYGLGSGGLTKAEAEQMEALGERISQAERRAMEAERETIDRYVAAFLSTKIGEILPTRITGVQPFGFFATVEDLGGDGLVPVSTLGIERFHYDEAARTLTGEDTGETYKIGQRIELRLAEANPVSASLRFELPEVANHMPMRNGQRRDRRPTGRRGRPANIRHRSR